MLARMGISAAHWIGTVSDSMGQYGTVWDSMGQYGTLWDSLGQYGTVWDSMLSRTRADFKSL